MKPLLESVPCGSIVLLIDVVGTLRSSPASAGAPGDVTVAPAAGEPPLLGAVPEPAVGVVAGVAEVLQVGQRGGTADSRPSETNPRRDNRRARLSDATTSPDC